MPQPETDPGERRARAPKLSVLARPLALHVRRLKPVETYQDAVK
jgi:hypothetical protein